jgi:nitrate/nitrite transporter NarK
MAHTVTTVPSTALPERELGHLLTDYLALDEVRVFRRLLVTRLGLLALAAGLGAAGVAPAWAVCLDVGGAHAGVISGAMNMFGNLGGTLCPIVVGACVKRLGSWQVALFTVAALYAVAALAWLFVDPARTVVD